MTVRDRLLAGLARQLGHPRGPLGRVVADRLNRLNRTVLAAAVTLLSPTAGETVADIGFGGGATLRPLLDAVGPAGQVLGIDISAVALDRARRRHAAAVRSGHLHIRDGSLLLLPLPASTLDAVLTVNTVYFVDDLSAAAAELQRVLRPGGRLVVGIGDPEAMRSLPFTAHGFRLRPVPELIAVLAAGGLVPARHDRVGDGDPAAHLLLFDRP